MDGIFFEDMGTFEKVADKNEYHEPENFNETIHVDFPYWCYAIGIVHLSILKFLRQKDVKIGQLRKFGKKIIKNKQYCSNDFS